jgi:hypothetical protein
VDSSNKQDLVSESTNPLTISSAHTAAVAAAAAARAELSALVCLLTGTASADGRLAHHYCCCCCWLPTQTGVGQAGGTSLIPAAAVCAQSLGPCLWSSLLLLLLLLSAWRWCVSKQELAKQVVGSFRLHVRHHVACVPYGGKRKVLVVNAPPTNLQQYTKNHVILGWLHKWL